MVQDSKDGKLDYIITKSISRFARNTLECLAYVRQLQKNGTQIYFEKENIDTGTAFSEMLLTILAAFAQEFPCGEEITMIPCSSETGEGVDAVSSIAHFCEYLVFGALLNNALRHHVPLRCALIAAVLDMRLKRAVPVIFLGVTIAGCIITMLTHGVSMLV